MFDLKQLFIGSLAATFTGIAYGATITSVGTTGVFDENGSGTNTTDTNAQAVTAATFSATVATAYNNDLGGVIDWDTGVTASASNGGTANNGLTSVDATYGISGTQTLTVTFDRAMDLYTNNINGQVSPLSFNNGVIADGASTGLAYGMSFSGADVVEVGLGMLARSTFGATGVDLRATATFSDTSTTVTDFFVNDSTSTSDTFVHFAATGGLTITSVFVEYVDDNGGGLADGQRRPVMDDVGFVLVPEPTSLALLGLGGLLIGSRRRYS